MGTKKILIYSKSKEKGFQKLQSIISEINADQIVKVRKGSYEIYAELKDGTMYQVVSASSSSRGHKCNKAYVDINTDNELVNCVVKPALIVSNLPREEQIEYF